MDTLDSRADILVQTVFTILMVQLLLSPPRAFLQCSLYGQVGLLGNLEVHAYLPLFVYNIQDHKVFGAENENGLGDMLLGV